MTWNILPSPPHFEAFDRLVSNGESDFYRIRLREKLSQGSGLLTRAWRYDADAEGELGDPICEAAHSLFSTPPDLTGWIESITIKTAETAHATHQFNTAFEALSVEVSAETDG